MDLWIKDSRQLSRVFSTTIRKKFNLLYNEICFKTSILLNTNKLMTFFKITDFRIGSWFLEKTYFKIDEHLNGTWEQVRTLWEA